VQKTPPLTFSNPTPISGRFFRVSWPHENGQCGCATTSFLRSIQPCIESGCSIANSRNIRVLVWPATKRLCPYVHFFLYIFSITKTEPAAGVPRAHAQLYYCRAECPLLRLAFYDKLCFTNRIYPTECYKDAVSLFCTSRQYLYLTAQMWGLVRIQYDAIVYILDFFEKLASKTRPKRQDPKKHNLHMFLNECFSFNFHT